MIKIDQSFIYLMTKIAITSINEMNFIFIKAMSLELNKSYGNF
jgi:hypothetical protein